MAACLLPPTFLKRANMHKSNTLTLFDPNGTEPYLESSLVFSLVFIAIMATVKKVYTRTLSLKQLNGSLPSYSVYGDLTYLI